MRNPNEVGIFVYKRDRFLVLRRTDARRAWHVVAGVLEPGESFPTAAARELREETGLALPLTDLGVPQRYLVDDDYRPLYAPDVTHVQIHTYAVEAPPLWEPILNEEHDIYRWCTVSEAMALLHWPEAREALARLAERLGVTT
jgi:8-oxo-dGTP pyrophosphatase MutT (NUDIX family)